MSFLSRLTSIACAISAVSCATHPPSLAPSAACPKDCGGLHHRTAVRLHDVSPQWDPRERSLPHNRACMEIHASASGQFSEYNFEQIRNESEHGLVVIDLREESHLFANGYPITWSGPREWSNAGLDLAAIEEDEAHRRKTLIEEPPLDLPAPESSRKIRKRARSRKSLPPKIESEKEFLARAQVPYFRLPVTASVHPSDATVDRFIDILHQQEPETWIHFHDRTGYDRSTIFLILLDILRNAKRLSLDEIVRRQVEISEDPNAVAIPPESDWRFVYQKEKAEFLEVFYRFAVLHPGGEGAIWSQWIRQSENLADLL